MTARQLKFDLPQWGGRRRRAGRKPKGKRAGVSHKARARFDKASAVHVTLRVGEHVWNLRSQRCFGVIHECFADARGRFGLRIIEFSVLGNHLHLLVEADSSGALSRGMQGLGVRVAKALNRLMSGEGRVFADHYHSRLLRTPTELVRALAYVLGNAAHHYGAATDAYSSASCDRERVLGERRTWLLRTGWRRALRVGLADPPLQAPGHRRITSRILCKMFQSWTEHCPAYRRAPSISAKVVTTRTPPEVATTQPPRHPSTPARRLEVRLFCTDDPSRRARQSASDSSTSLALITCFCNSTRA